MGTLCDTDLVRGEGPLHLPTDLVLASDKAPDSDGPPARIAGRLASEGLTRMRRDTRGRDPLELAALWAPAGSTS